MEGCGDCSVSQKTIHSNIININEEKMLDCYFLQLVVLSSVQMRDPALLIRSFLVWV